MAPVLQNSVLMKKILFFFPFFLITSIFAEENIRLLNIPMVEAPVIENNVLKIKVDLVFDKCPEEYWIYYNRGTGRLVIEFFGFHMDAPPLKIQGTSVLSDPVHSNNETNLSLKGKSCTVSMAMQQGWHYDSKVLDGKVLRLQLWMPLNPQKTLMANKKRFVLPIILTLVGAAGLTYLLFEVIH